MNSKVARIEEPMVCPTIDRIASPVVPLSCDPTEISIVVLDEPESTEIKIEPLDIEEINIIEAHEYAQGQGQIPFDHPEVHNKDIGFIMLYYGTLWVDPLLYFQNLTIDC